jgi:hypothetical protein
LADAIGNILTVTGIVDMKGGIDMTVTGGIDTTVTGGIDMTVTGRIDMTATETKSMTKDDNPYASRKQRHP